MPFFQETRPSRIMYPLALVGLLIPVAATKVVDLDIWWHLATGWVIATLRIIPRYDLFSFTAFGAPWVNHEWLFQLAAWKMVGAFGVASLTAMKVVLVAATAFVVFRTIALLARSPSAALWGTAALLWAISNRVMERPFLVGLLFLALFCFILYRFAETGTWALWLLPPLEALWINIHGGALEGAQVVLLFALGETANAVLARFGGPPPIAAERRRRLWLIGFACVAAGTINPWGIDTLFFPFTHLRMTAILSGTQEWLPLLHPFLDRFLPPFFALACLTATLAAFALNAGRARLSHLFLVALMALLLLKSHRFIPDFLVVAIPLFCGEAAAIARRRLPQRPPSWASAWAHLALVFALSAMAMVRGVPVTTGGETLAEVGVGTLMHSAPKRMVDFLEANDIRGRVFNDMGLGGYLIYRRWPRELVFIDGRTPVYGDAFYERYVDAFRTSRNFEELDRQYGFDYMVFSGLQVWNDRYFHKYMWERPDWRLVYLAEDGIVYVRNLPKFKELIATSALKTNPLVERIREDDERKEREKQRR